MNLAQLQPQLVFNFTIHHHTSFWWIGLYNSKICYGFLPMDKELLTKLTRCMFVVYSPRGTDLQCCAYWMPYLWLTIITCAKYNLSVKVTWCLQILWLKLKCMLLQMKWAVCYLQSKVRYLLHITLQWNAMLLWNLALHIMMIGITCCKLHWLVEADLMLCGFVKVTSEMVILLERNYVTTYFSVNSWLWIIARCWSDILLLERIW